MSLHLHNTLLRDKEEFTPINPKEVGIYACGITLYDDIHVGHLKSILSIEILKNWLEHKGSRVRLVRNITDIDDKIIARALKANQSPMAYVQHYIDRYHLEHKAFGFSTNYEEPRVSEYLPQIFNFITDLIQKDTAYAANALEPQNTKDVYFKVDKAQSPEGRYILSGKKIDDLQSSGRVANKDNKENSSDFALWKSDNEYGWESPWGQGRPGWHIECSVMHYHTLGAHFDIHAGGRDLVFPHHENEIHQSYAHNGVNPANYWFHNGVVKVKALNEEGVEIDQKLSKSLGNSVYTKDLRETYSVEAIKFFLNFARPTSDQYYEKIGLDTAQKTLNRLYEKAASLPSNLLAQEIAQLHNAFTQSGDYEKITQALDDNLNTPVVAALIHELSQKAQLDLESAYTAFYALSLTAVNAHDLSFTQFLSNAQLFTQQAKEKEAQLQAGAPAEILDLAQKRWEAKAQKNWAQADTFKKEIIAQGWSVEDNKEGWKLIKLSMAPEVEFGSALKTKPKP